MLRLWRRRHLDERVRRAREGAEQSRRELAHTRQQVVEPSKRYSDRNHFADMIRATLLDGGDRN